HHDTPLAPPLAVRSIAGGGWEGVAVGSRVASIHPSPTLPFACSEREGADVARCLLPCSENQKRFMERSEAAWQSRNVRKNKALDCFAALAMTSGTIVQGFHNHFSPVWEKKNGGEQTVSLQMKI
ncbi:MAG: hypothetical protein NW204_11045, partial [Xanthomonadaceae bacterium]|nr:hypothetical protein [Xanthomonadaceae bacterium]